MKRYLNDILKLKISIFVKNLGAHFILTISVNEGLGVYTDMISSVVCNMHYYMTNSYRPSIKKFDWFKAGL